MNNGNNQFNNNNHNDFIDDAYMKYFKRELKSVYKRLMTGQFFKSVFLNLLKKISPETHMAVTMNSYNVAGSSEILKKIALTLEEQQDAKKQGLADEFYFGKENADITPLTKKERRARRALSAVNDMFVEPKLHEESAVSVGHKMEMTNFVVDNYYATLDTVNSLVAQGKNREAVVQIVNAITMLQAVGTKNNFNNADNAIHHLSLLAENLNDGIAMAEAGSNKEQFYLNKDKMDEKFDNEQINSIKFAYKTNNPKVIDYVIKNESEKDGRINGLYMQAFNEQKSAVEKARDEHMWLRQVLGGMTK